MTDIILVLISAVTGGGLSSLILGVYQSRKQAPVSEAEVKKLKAEAHASEFGLLRERIAILEDALQHRDRQLLDKDGRINELEARILSLQKQLSGMQTTITAMSVELEALRQLARQVDDDPDAE